MKVVTAALSFLDLADAVRAAVCQLYDELDEKPVHVARILGTLHDRFGPVLSDSTDAPVWALVENQEELSHSSGGRMLHFLTYIGDLAHVGDGYYVPTGVRLIRLPGGWSLLLSGESSRRLAAELSIRVDQESLGRLIGPASTNLSDSISVAGFDGWLNRPLWCRNSVARLDILEQSMPRRSEDAVEWQVYNPTRRSAAYYKARWISVSDDEAKISGLALCRHKSGHYAAARLTRNGTSVRFARRMDLNYEELLEACTLRDREIGLTTILKLERQDKVWVFSPRFPIPAFIIRYCMTCASQIDGELKDSVSFSFTDSRLSLLESLLRGLPFEFRRIDYVR